MIISILPGEEYDISEAEQKELDEKLNEIKEDISEDDKLADDVEKMIQQQVNVRFKISPSPLITHKERKYCMKYFFRISELPC